MPFNHEFKVCQRLIGKFCHNPKSWANEIKMARRLLKICPDMDAWESLILPTKINSLSFFFCAEGKSFIPKSMKNPDLLDLDRL